MDAQMMEIQGLSVSAHSALPLHYAVLAALSRFGWLCALPIIFARLRKIILSPKFWAPASVC